MNATDLELIEKHIIQIQKSELNCFCDLLALNFKIMQTLVGQEQTQEVKKRTAKQTLIFYLLHSSYPCCL